MDIGNLATNAVSLLVPYLVEASKSVANNVGEDAWNLLNKKIEPLYKLIKNKFHKDDYASKTLKRLEEKPEDEDRQNAMKSVLKEVLTEDNIFKEMLSKLVIEMKQEGSDNVIQANINGPAATHGGVAVNGNNNLNVGVGCENINEINIDKINMVKPESEEPIIYYQDEISNKLTIKFKAIDHIEKISLVLGLISSVITIVGILFDVKNIFPYIILLLFIFMYSAFYFWNMKKTLEKDGKINFGKRGKKIILDDNELLITEKVGECLICHNKVYVYYDKSVNMLFGRCSNYEKHLYSYDPTIDMGVPI